MADFFDQVGQAIGTFAPVLAGAFGGPLAGTAAQFVVKALGLSPDVAKDPKALAAALQFATPEQQIAVQKADLDFKAHLADLGIEEDKIAAGDRDSARKREADVKDYTPSLLALSITLGFFGVLTFMLVHGLPKDMGGSEAFLVLLGSLGTGFATVLGYYFGSSVGNKAKDTVIANMAGK